MAWYEDIEAEIEVREAYATYSTAITEFEQYIHKLELRALAYKSKNGFQPQIYTKVVRDIYFTEEGDKRTVDTVVNEQNIVWINDYIQRHASSAGIRISAEEIRSILHDVSNAYTAAEMKRTSVTLQLSTSLRHRLRNAG